MSGLAGAREAQTAPSSTAARDRRGLLRLTRSRLLHTVAAALFYAAFSVFVTWPALTDLDETFYGAAGDPFGTMAFFRELVEQGANPFTPGRLEDFAAPEGRAIPWARDLAAAPSVTTLYLLTSGFGPIAALTLYTLAGYVLSGTAMFLLVRRLTANAWIAALAGWAFAFFPFVVLNGQGHIDYIHNWVFVLMLWRLLTLNELPSWRNGVLAGLGTAFAMWWNPYFILLAGVAYAAFTLTALVLAARGGTLRAQLAPQLAGVAIVGLFLVSLLVIATVGAQDGLGLRQNALVELVTYSARPLEYVIPPAQSLLLGDLTGPYLATHLHGSNSTESTLYVGVSLILLAATALVAAALGRPGASDRRTVTLLTIMGLAAAVTSAPPEAQLLGVTVPFPSRLITEVTSTWRVYARFVLVVMLALVPLAALGLAWLVHGRPPMTQAAILLAVTGVVAVDLWSRLDGRTNTVVVPPVYEALKRQPPGTVAEYPVQAAGTGTYGDEFYQQFHGKPILGGYDAGSRQELRALTLQELDVQATRSGLSTVGVRYVLVRNEFPKVAAAARKGVGLEPVARDRYATVYRVTAAPRPFAYPAVGFDAPEPSPQGGTLSWLLEPSGEIEVTGLCSPCVGVLSMRLTSFARKRLVTVRASDGSVLVRRRIATRPVRLAMRFAGGSTRLTVESRPGPEPVAPITGTPDPRSVGVAVSELRFRSSADPR